MSRSDVVDTPDSLASFRRALVAALAGFVLALALAFLFGGCSDRRLPTEPQRPSLRPAGAATVSNWHAIKLPVSIQFTKSVLYFAMRPDTSAAGKYCERESGRATAYDANGRVIDDSLGTWTSLDTTLVLIDSLGYMNVAACPHLSPTQVDTTVHTVGVLFTLTQAK